MTLRCDKLVASLFFESLIEQGGIDVESETPVMETSEVDNSGSEPIRSLGAYIHRNRHVGRIAAHAVDIFHLENHADPSGRAAKWPLSFWPAFLAPFNERFAATEEP